MYIQHKTTTLISIIIFCLAVIAVPHISRTDCCIIAGSTPQSISGDASSGQTQELPNPLGVTSIPQLIGIIIKGALGIIGSLALLMFMYGGFVWMTSAGNEKRVEKGKEVLTWAVIGLIVIFASYILVSFVIQRLTAGGGS